jgi:isocitrate dehydrogenase kinase/phosphatase
MPISIKIKKTMYTLSDLSNLIGVSVTVLRGDMTSGNLKTIRHGRLIYVPADEVCQYVKKMGFNVKLELNKDIEITNK